MPLMCCDTCSDLDFKPLGLGAVYVCVCPFCKKLSTHSAIAHYGHFNLKRPKSDEIVLSDLHTWIYASGSIEKANLGLSLQVSSAFKTVRAREMLQ
jgi:hypothetical protein